MKSERLRDLAIISVEREVMKNRGFVDVLFDHAQERTRKKKN